MLNTRLLIGDMHVNVHILNYLHFILLFTKRGILSDVVFYPAWYFIRVVFYPRGILSGVVFYPLTVIPDVQCIDKGCFIQTETNKIWKSWLNPKPTKTGT